MTLKEKIDSKTAAVGIIGLGYVGLPLAIACAKAGFSVIGIEKSSEKLQMLTQGKSYINDITDQEVAEHITNDSLVASSDASLLGQADIILICVPTPIDEHKVPDLSPVKDAAETIAEHIKSGQLIILESTTYPGCTEEFLRPILERKGLNAEKDFFLVFSPERVDPNNHAYPITKIPKVVGGLTQEATDLAYAFYATFTPTPFKVSSPKAAEMTKLLENMFRLVNISMINELSLLCGKMGIDIWEVIEAAKTKPYGFMPFYPGPGIGGHCIAIDPFYLTWKAKEFGFYPRFIELAGEINDLMAHTTVTKIIWALNQTRKSLNGSRILVLGVTYKKDIADMRESPAYPIIADLIRKKANIAYHDPGVPNLTIDGADFESTPLSKEEISNADLVLILTDHSSIDYDMIADNAKFVVDTRHVIKEKRPTIIH